MKYCFVFIVLLISFNSFAQEESQRQPPLMKDFSSEEINNITDDLLEVYVEKDLFSGVVLIAKDKNPVYLKAFGKADYEQNRELKPDTKFDIGSINKDFTKIAIMQLYEKDKLDVEDNIGKYLSGFPDEVLNKVTIRQLLNHTSGFGDYLMLPGVIEKLPELTTIDKIIETFKDEPLHFEPGTENQYSNAGYAVLGAVIESVSGVSYFDYVEQNILQPVGLNETYFDYKKIRSANEIPVGYMFSSTGEKIRIEYEETPSPSGSAFATAEDLLKFELSFLYDNKMLKDETKIFLINELQTVENITWDEVINDPSYLSAMAGGAPGRNSVVYSQPATGYIIIVLANYDEPVAEQVGDNIYRLLSGREVKEPELPVFRKLYNAYKENGKDYLQNNFFKIIEGGNYEMEDFLLNRVGYDLLNENRTKEAIDIFSVNTDLFPEIANTWDSLAEAYAAAGETETAIELYKKVVKMQPDGFAGQNAKKMLEKLEQNK